MKDKCGENLEEDLLLRKKEQLVQKVYSMLKHEQYMFRENKFGSMKKRKR